MKAITVYEAKDGRRFDTVDEAEERDVLLCKVAEALEPLGDKPKLPGCGFENGDGYLQHKPETVARVREALWALTRDKLTSWIESQKKVHGKTEAEVSTAHPSWFQRMLDGSCPPLENAWNRIVCIDEQFREWGQPYYASHPSEGKQVRLND